MGNELLNLSQEEAELIRVHRENKKKEQWYNAAITDVHNLLQNLADQCAGGSGEGGDVYKNIATQVEKLYKGK